MDKLKGMASKVTGGESSGGNPQTGGSGGGLMKEASGYTGQNKDYGDKGVEAAEKKFGIQHNQARDEMMTDKARGMFESSTGKKVPEKFSN